jgi:TPR repeat protein|uniref:RING-type domain-containing protein n=1 Tax=Attheya septentrionalis TaxID=420275 RepID=A0A7S2UG81_9STRA|mmetsp:Transcript_22001/g.39676  ORF Transcript_22001/g.39676 Transcript_22001/m.39676 type:complete len:285 (+) Transcript_22001:152-1006(+)|eukprot:CAMPEP_0198299268 /NCGR_PEP_ID=MMETSP1449-20131203/44088_1 /TAXON_ID=420275 /ORGANISM="Attheya septentrionalis, Strain CCMP2084" /LENGTH=284 /DNA_ID=CAMNT_0044000765 /DNA_START=70 /DNA_END=924 /DNA_ORIENTATION=+
MDPNVPFRDYELYKRYQEGGQDPNFFKPPEDPDLFKPPPQRADCPICMIVLPSDSYESMYYACCGNKICRGCDMECDEALAATNRKNAGHRNPIMSRCPFCKTKAPTSNKMLLKQVNKRVDLNDANAMCILGNHYKGGECGMPRDDRKAFNLYVRAAELGFAEACSRLSQFYRMGNNVVFEEEVMARKYLEMAAKGGDSTARHNLGVVENEKGNYELAIKHWRLSAGAGDQDSLDCIKRGFQKGCVTKVEFAETLRAFQSSISEQKSDSRDKWLTANPNSGNHW